MDAEDALARSALCVFHGVFHSHLEGLVEALEHGAPVQLALRDDVKLGLHVCGEVVVENVGEVLEQKVVHHQADVGGEELSALLACVLLFRGGLESLAVQRQHAVFPLHPVAILFHHVASLLHDVDGGGVGGRAANAQFLEPLDQTCLRVPRGVLAEPLRGDNGVAGQILPFGHGGKHVFGGFVHAVFVVGAFQVQLQEAFKGDDFAPRHEPLFTS